MKRYYIIHSDLNGKELDFLPKLKLNKDETEIIVVKRYFYSYKSAFKNLNKCYRQVFRYSSFLYRLDKYRFILFNPISCHSRLKFILFEIKEEKIKLFKRWYIWTKKY